MRNPGSRFEHDCYSINSDRIKHYRDEFTATLAAAGYARLSIGLYVTSNNHFARWLHRAVN
jgi:hypothetical protein